MRPSAGWKRAFQLRSGRHAIEAEVEAHLEARRDQLISAGLSVADAAAQARSEFGDIEDHVKAATRELPLGERSRVAAWLSAVGGDFRFAALSLVRNKSFSSIAVGIVAAAIASCAAVFGILSAYLFRPLPYPDAERVVLITRTPINDQTTSLRPSVPGGLNGIEWDRSDRVMEYSAAWELDGFSLVAEGGAEIVNGAWVTAGLFPITGARTQLGRVFTSEDVRAAAPLAVLSHRLWTTRFESDPGVLGTTIRAWSNDRPDDPEVFEVIGVLRPGFWPPGLEADLLVPLAGTRRPAIARLREGISLDEASAHLTSIARDRLSAVDPDWSMVVTPLQEALFGGLRPALRLLGATAILVLLIAAANVTVLNLVRSLHRQHEISIRAAIGAGRQRLFRQFVAEGTLLVGVAAALGLGVAAWLLRVLRVPIESYLGAGAPGGEGGLTVDTRVSLIILGCSAFVVLFLGAATALSLRKGYTSLRGGAVQLGGLKTLRSSLVALEVALSFTLLLGAGQLLRETQELSQTETGFSSAEVLKGGLALRERAYPTGRDRTRVFYDIMGRVRQSTGARSVALASPYPFEPRSRRGELLEAEGTAEAGGNRAVHHIVTESYFSTLGIPIVLGREFSAADVADSDPVAMISQALAEQLWPGQSPLGKKLRTGSWRSMPPVTDSPWRTVVGVAGDVRTRLAGESFPATYVPYRQDPVSDISILIAAQRVDGLAAVLKTAVTSVDAELPVRDILSLEEVIKSDFAQPRFLTGILVIFSGFAVLLAVAGTHAVVAYSVSLRSREAAIRAALGATRSQVTRSLMLRSLAATGLGLVFGAAGARALDSGLIVQMPAAHAAGLLTYLVVGLSMAVILGVSIWIPARRAYDKAPASILRAG